MFQYVPNYCCNWTQIIIYNLLTKFDESVWLSYRTFVWNEMSIQKNYATCWNYENLKNVLQANLCHPQVRLRCPNYTVAHFPPQWLWTATGPASASAYVDEDLAAKFCGKTNFDAMFEEMFNEKQNCYTISVFFSSTCYCSPRDDGSGELESA